MARATVLVAGIAMPGSAMASVVPVSPLHGIPGPLLNSQLRALQSLPTQVPLITPSGIFQSPSGLPGVQLHGIEGVLWNTELNAFEGLPSDLTLNTGSLGAATSPGLPGSGNPMTPTGDFAIAGTGVRAPDFSGAFVPGQGNAGPAPMPSAGLSRQVDGTVSSNVDDIAALLYASRAKILGQENPRILCNAQMPSRLQTGGEFWAGEAGRGAPVPLPTAEYAASSYANPVELEDSALGPNGNPTNVASQAPADAWCNPPPVSFYQSSPLAHARFWTPFALILAGVMVLWLSRGRRLPHI